jgi:hypothetical protein
MSFADAEINLDRDRQDTSLNISDDILVPALVVTISLAAVIIIAFIVGGLIIMIRRKARQGY